MHSVGDMLDDAFVGERVGYCLRMETGWMMHSLGDQMEDRLRQ